MLIYISTRKQSYGQRVREQLIAAGHQVNSSWLDDANHARPTDEATKQRLASKATREIAESDVLLLLTEPDRKMTLGSKFVDLGIAIGLAMNDDTFAVHMVGNPENLMAHHPVIEHHASVERFLMFISKRPTKPVAA